VKRLRHLFRLILVLLAVQGCSVVPHTQRKTLVLTSPSQEMAMGEEAYREVLAKAKLSKNKKWILIVDRVEYQRVPNPYGKGESLF